VVDAVETVSATTPRRHVERPTAYGTHRRDDDAALTTLDHLTQGPSGHRYVVERERYGYTRHEVTLLAGLTETGDAQVPEVGAQWDSVIDGPGAE
jgi:hypothetical protein